MTIRAHNKDIVQFIKFILVGIINTTLTYITYVILRLFKIPPIICNTAGYIIGVINSYLWNKKWVFKTTETNVKKEFIHFIFVFFICYILQLLVFYLMINYTAINEYIIQIVGMAVYTILNYTLNRIYSFKE